MRNEETGLLCESGDVRFISHQVQRAAAQPELARDCVVVVDAMLRENIRSRHSPKSDRTSTSRWPILNECRPMRLLFLNHHPSLYGATRSLVDLVTGLKSFDVESKVVSPSDGPAVALLRSHGVEHEVVPFELSMTERPNRLRGRVRRALSEAACQASTTQQGRIPMGT